MARFNGTVQDFHQYLGPRLRNVINLAAAAQRKLCGGICQECGQKAELQSAHIHGRGRRVLIESVLADYVQTGGLVDCDLEEAERRIIAAHMPIEETFRFLCHPCHVAYDAGTRERKERNVRRHPQRMQADGEFKKLDRIAYFAERPKQANHRIIKAFLSLEKLGEVELRAFKQICEDQFHITDFHGKYASMKTDAGNSYGKFFYDDGTIVRLWPEVRAEIVAHFPLA